MGSNEPYTNDSPISAVGQNEAHWRLYRKVGLNTIRQLQDRDVDFSADGGEWAEAYVDSNGRKNSVVGETTVFDTDKYKSTLNTSASFVVIEATSVDETAFSINDCGILQINSNKWYLNCIVGTDEEKRAKIYKTLFYGTDGTDPRASSTYITGITALKTSISRDVGKRAHYLAFSKLGNGTEYVGTITGTYDNTSTNVDCSYWSNVNGSGVSTDVTTAYFNGSVVNDSNYPHYTSNEIGTDTTTDELDNPLNLKAKIDQDYPMNATCDILTLCVGDITWGSITNTGGNTPVALKTDFYTDNSIPLFTAATETISDLLIEHSTPSGTFSSTINSSFGTALVADWETGANIQYKVTNDTEDSGWLDYNKVSTFTPFTSEPTKVIVKLIPKSSGATAGYPSIKGVSVQGWGD